ncbi:MAG: hypothetical protein H7X91_07005, partial [Burkholderiales bacterium]|nr:hypothetical protein [Burkholderiales bacterium]
MNPPTHSLLTWPLLSAFQGLTTPIFVFDPERARIRWANESARALWRAKTLDALLERDFSDMSDVARARFDGVMETVRRGEKIKRDWTLYPFSGEPINCLMTISGIVLEDGRLACLHEAQVIDSQLISPSLLRGIEVVRHTGSKVSLHRKDGVAVMRNPAATNAFGPLNEAANANDLAQHLGGAAEAERALTLIARGEVYSASTPLPTRQGPLWHQVDARGVPDPVTGEAMVLVNAQDITDSRFAERMLATENSLMQMIARGAPPDKIAVSLVQAIEQFSSGMLCSLQLLNGEETRLVLAAGPNLPPAYRRAIEDLPVGPGITGRFSEQTLITEIAGHASGHTSSRANADVAIQYGLYPSWSTPVVSSTGEMLGVLAGYYRERREPDAQVRRVIDSVRHLA